jgi:cytochrome P450
MARLVDELIEGFAGRGRCEFVAEFADQYPVRVICEVLGVPPEDHGLFAQWGDVLTYILSLELSAHLPAVQDAVGGLGAYVDDLVAERRRDPRDDLVGALVQVSEDGDRLSAVELRAMIGGLLFAGYDTTRNQLGHAIVAFCRHPDQWARLGDDPQLAPKAVNEVMRLSGAVAGVPRLAAADVDVDGWVVPAGTLVYLSVASANRDESVFDDSLRFDITVDRPPHLTFGAGPHYCLGANLARAEMEVALAVLASRLRNVRLDGDPVWRTGTGISGPSSLPIAFEAE